MRLRIALLIESSRASGRALLRGIASYSHAHGHWALYHQERALADAAPSWMKRWQGDGILARIESPKLARQIAQMGLPTVDLRGRFELPGVPRIANDQDAIARLAADHLLERHFQHFGYCGLAGVNYSEHRADGFVHFLGEQGYPVSVYQGRSPGRGVSALAVETQGLVDEAALVEWLRSLPKPVGVMACNDVRADQVLLACAAAGFHVPDEVAVIGAGNDEVVCELANPPLSSVEPDLRRVGFQAAALLDRMIRGERPQGPAPRVAPLGVVTRQSTDVVAIPDADVATAVRFIREHAGDGIDIGDVLRHVALSRSTLERRFAQYLGRSPKAEILRVQLQRVKQLLRATEYPLADIAERAGFSHVANMCHLFKQKVGCTPGEYRQGRD